MKRNWKVAGMGVGAAFLLSAAATGVPVYAKAAPAKAAATHWSGQDVGFNTQDPYFVDNDTLGSLYDQVVSSGAKWVRATLFWDLMQPTKNGSIDWSQADKIFRQIKSHHLKYDMVIRSAPDWATVSGADTSNHNYAVTDGPAFQKFCYEVAKRYLNKGVTIVFEIGNEENMPFFNMPAVDPAQYTKDMLIPAYKGIHSAAKELGVRATVLVGGFSPVDPQYIPGVMTPLNFLKGIYKSGGKPFFDSIAYHPYTYVSPATSDHWTFVELRSLVMLMNKEGDKNRKIYATEAGWATGNGDGEVSESDQATWTGQLMDYWFSLPYAGPLIFYELVDNQSYDDSNRENTFGLMYSTQWPYAPKPAYKVFEQKLQAANKAAKAAKTGKSK